MSGWRVMNGKNPQVTIVTPGTFPIPSYYSSSVERVVEHVTQELKHDIRFHVISKKTYSLPASQELDGVRHIRFPALQKKHYLLNVNRFLENFTPCVIQVENRPRYARWLKKRDNSRKIWLSLHSTTFISPPHIRRLELIDCLHYTDKVLVNSYFLKKELLSYCPWMEEKIFVNHLGVDPERFVSRWRANQEYERKQMLLSLGFQERKLILYVGRLIRIKGVHLLLQVMPEIIKKHPDVCLIIVGGAGYGNNRRTRYVQYLEKLAARIPHHVKFIPYISHNRITMWYRAADVVVIPSQDREAFGLVAVEAMASGVPVIASQSGGLKEIIEHECTGYLLDYLQPRYDLLQRVDRLLSDNDLVRQMGEKGIERVQKYFTWQHTAKRILPLYRDTINQSQLQNH